MGEGNSDGSCGGGGNGILTIADKGEGGVQKILTFADGGGGGGQK